MDDLTPEELREEVHGIQGWHPMRLDEADPFDAVTYICVAVAGICLLIMLL